MNIAYLVNQYPKVSHTFIRREIHALEGLGCSVSRYSIRPSPDELADPSDLAEVERTEVLLDAGAIGLARGLLECALGSPRLFLSAVRLAVSIGWRSDRGLLVHGIYLAEACVLRSRLRARGCRHLHAHFGTNPATVAMLCRELGGPPYSFTVHGPEEFDKAPLLALRQKIERAAFVVAVSSFGRSQLLRQCDAGHWGKIHVVRCGVDEEFLRQGLDPTPQDPRLVCVGRLCEQKGQLLLVEAAARLASDGVSFELVLVGDGEMREEVERRVTRFGLEDRVRITGWMDGEGVRAEIRGARALVLPSFAEGLPVVLMEAMALGRPTASTFVAGIPELVEPGVSGWLFPAGSVDCLVDAMRAALGAAPEKLTAMGGAGRARVAAQHDIRRNAELLGRLMTTGAV